MPKYLFLPLPKEAILNEISPSSHYQKMGCLILAGGQGTRLGIDGPKGCVKLPLKEEKTLFELLFDKINKKGKDLSVAIMTSPLNHDATLNYLKKNAYFGLTHIDLFSQEMRPMCDDNGEECAAQAPDGNGKAFMHLYRSGIWEKWKRRGIEFAQVVPVDNPLADPFDGELLAIHEKENVELVLRCIKRETPEEKLGIVGAKDEKLMVCEYSEVPTQLEEWELFLGNTGLFSCTMEFVKRAADLPMPWHLAHKEIKKGVWMWKSEAFIFDLFPSTRSFKVLLSNRKQCFAPLKNHIGEDSLETVSKILEEVIEK